MNILISTYWQASSIRVNMDVPMFRETLIEIAEAGLVSS